MLIKSIFMLLTSIGILPIACAASVWKKTLCARQISPVIKTPNQNQITLTNCYDPKDSSTGSKAWLNPNQQQVIELSEVTKAEMGAVMFLLHWSG